ncbi:MAG: FecR domain-containing protein, partial [Candidatus Aminicenantes bacterium]|nr:FecR domain-containing protein [Candidatus Aminicenantes bacterium]
MRAKASKTIVFLAGLVGVMSVWAGAAERYQVVEGPKDMYFGHVSFVEIKGDGKDPVVLRAGALQPETAALNLPIGPGDTIRTYDVRRCEVQFDTGTIVRLDVATELKVETILAQSLSSARDISNLVLNRGRIYVMYKEYKGSEIFQVLTSYAALKLKHNTVAIVKTAEDGSTDVQVKLGKVSALFGAAAKATQTRDIGKQERLIILAGDQVQVASYIADTDFELWNEEVNRDFEKLHKGQSALPGPIRNLPLAVQYFAEKYGSIHGEWVWHNLYGYVWRPFYNDVYPWGTWSPYVYGRWSVLGGQMFWVPGEPWGWVPYHLGIWHWDKEKGWVWLPGSLFAPAWVDWAFFYGHWGWRPWSLWDWYYGDHYFWFADGAWSYGWYGWYGYEGPYGSTDTSQIRPWKRPLEKVTIGQLKKPASPRMPMPKEIKEAFGRTTVGLERNYAGLWESVQKVRGSLVFVPGKDLNARDMRGRVVPFDKVPKPAGEPVSKTLLARPNVEGDAARAWKVREAVERAESEARQLPGGVRRAEGVRSAPPAGGPVLRGGDGAMLERTVDRMKSFHTLGSGRFRDWNPDLRVAADLGVSIEYRSGRNEVYCPELRFSSRDRQSGIISRGPRLSSGGISGGGWG